MTEHSIPVVFDLESGTEPTPLGRYDHTDEYVVVYYSANGMRHTAPDDCVKVVNCVVTVP